MSGDAQVAVPQYSLGTYADAVEKRLERWQGDHFGARVWQKDPTLWGAPGTPEITDRLGWLSLGDAMPAELGPWQKLAADIRAEGYQHVVVLGMGGSSLAPEVFARTFGAATGFPDVRVLDSTHPVAVRALFGTVDPHHTLYLVSSKSGTTTEVLSFFYTAWAELGGDESARGRSFVAITDPGTPLVQLAQKRGFRAIVNAPPDVGGRYSALTPFGLVPATLLGADTAELLARGRAMEQACGPDIKDSENPGLRLGAILGELTLAGRDKVTFFASNGIVSFPDWLEQLIAESTGKDGRGIVPVVGEVPAGPEAYGNDRFFVALTLAGESAPFTARLSALAAAGHPVAHFELRDLTELGAEMFRWEMAVAAAGAVIGVQPFNQPDVQFAKHLATEAMQKASGSATVSGDQGVSAGDSGAMAIALEGLVAGVSEHAYLGIQAYLQPHTHDEVLRRLQARLRDRTRLATTFGYGPRFLHSTGQLHKGGPVAARFLQLVDTPTEDLAVPETNYTFARLLRAQADGDRQALLQRGHTVLRIDLGREGVDALERVGTAIESASIGPGRSAKA
jgi:transaldolase/glucose-6-phosphate isomerase